MSASLRRLRAGQRSSSAHDFHPHLHRIVTGGALSPGGKQWRSPKQRKFLFPFPIRALAALFRGKFLAGLRQMLEAGELRLPDSDLETPVSRARWFRAALQKALDPLCQTSLWRTSAGLKATWLITLTASR
jgi:hypothetical protein